MTDAAFKDLQRRLENLERELAFVSGSGSRTNKNSKKKKDRLDDARQRFAKAYLKEEPKAG